MTKLNRNGSRFIVGCVAMGLASAGWAANVAVFNDPDYVDTANESAAIQSSLIGLGHTVIAFTGIGATSFTSAMASANLILFPHLEANLGTSLADALDGTAVNVLNSYVSNGGGLIALGGDAHRLLNRLFYGPFPDGLASSTLFSGGSFIQPEAVGSPFASAPAQLADLPGVEIGMNFFAFDPPGSLDLYRDSVSGTAAGGFNSTTVFVDDIGAGDIAYLSWSWLNATPGADNGGWNPVLDLAVNHVAAPVVVPLPATIPLFALALIPLLRRRRAAAPSLHAHSGSKPR